MPSWLHVPKCDRATVTAQRSAAQNGQDSSLTKTIAGLPSRVSSGPGLLTFSSNVVAWPWFTCANVAAGTVVTWRTRAAGAMDSLAVWCVGLAVSLTATSATTIASTAATAPAAARIRRRASARFLAARSAAIRSRARCLPARFSQAWLTYLPEGEPGDLSCVFRDRIRVLGRPGLAKASEHQPSPNIRSVVPAIY